MAVVRALRNLLKAMTDRPVASDKSDT